MTESTVLYVEVADWEWGDLEIRGENGEVVGHKIRPGSIIELQLWLQPRHIIKYWVRKPEQQKTNGFDVQYDLLQGLELGKDSGPVRKLIQPLRPNTNLVYFEGHVKKIESEDSKAEPGSKLVQALIDCGLPVVLTSLVDNKPSSLSFPVTSEGEDIIGVCRLLGSISTSATFFRAPLLAKFLSVRTLESLPRSVLLKVEIAPKETKPEHVLYYSMLER